MKKVIGIFFIVVFILINSASVFANDKVPFNDVKKNDWFYPYVYYLYDNNIASGKNVMAFSPEDNITRAEFIKILEFSVNDNSFEDYEIDLPYVDVQKDDWFYPYIKSMYSRGLIKDDSQVFSPNEPITREEALALLYDIGENCSGFALLKEKLPFLDENSILIQNRDKISTLQQAGIINGINGFFYPKKNITRAEVAKIITVYRQLNIDSSPKRTEEIMEYPVLASENKYYSELASNFSLSSLRNTKNVDFYLDQMEYNINVFLDDKKTDFGDKIDIMDLTYSDEQSFQLDSQMNTSSVTSSSYTAPLGTKKTYTKGNYYNSGVTSKTGVATATVAANYTRARSKNYTAGVGSANSWALTGTQVYFSGSGSRYAQITYKGSYAGKMNPGLMGGSSGVRGNLVVKDMTTGSIVNTISGINENISVCSTKAYYIPFSYSSSVRLYAGHTYLFYFSIGTSISNYSPQICWSDFYEPASPHDWGVRTTSVTISY